jgi:hypothetical protein
MNSLWLNLTRNGIRWAYLRATHAQDAEGGGHGVAAAFDGQLHDVLGVEVSGFGGEAGAGRVFDALVDRQDRRGSPVPAKNPVGSQVGA